MKVLYFHQHFRTPAQAGGTRSYELSQRLIKKGHQVKMVCGAGANLELPATDKKNILRGNVDGIDVIQINLTYSNYDGIVKRTFTFIRFALAGIRFALKEDYDLLFATSTPLTAGIPGIVMKWFRKKKFVFEVRDLWPELPKAMGMKNPVLLLGMSILESMSYKKADACIGLSPGICKGIQRIIGEEKTVEMIPNGCDTELFKPGKREDLNLPGIKLTDTVAVFTGAHGKANGLNAILDAAALLQKDNRDDIKLVFIGDGKLKPALRARANKESLFNCIFLEPIPKNELTNLLSSVDVGLMVLANVPAFYYGTSPNKFFDYISCGLPVINNYPGWLADIISENKCGIAVKPDDPVVFANAIKKIADNKSFAKEAGIRSRILAERDFDRDLLADKLVSFLENTYYSN